MTANISIRNSVKFVIRKKLMNSKSIIITIIIVLVIVLAGWYLYSYSAKPAQQNYTAQPNSNYPTDTTASISNDLSQLPDDSSVNSEMNSLNQSIQSF